MHQATIVALLGALALAHGVSINWNHFRAFRRKVQSFGPGYGPPPALPDAQPPQPPPPSVVPSTEGKSEKVTEKPEEPSGGEEEKPDGPVQAEGDEEKAEESTESAGTDKSDQQKQPVPPTTTTPTHEYKCKQLDPATNSDYDRKNSDKRCGGETAALPGWGKDAHPNCECTFPVKEREGECATRYWRRCRVVGADGESEEVATCPPLVFPEEKPGCMIVKMPDENGCDMLMLMCGNGSPGAIPSTDSAVTDSSVGEPVTAPTSIGDQPHSDGAVTDSAVGKPVTAPTGGVPSGYRSRQ